MNFVGSKPSYKQLLRHRDSRYLRMNLNVLDPIPGLLKATIIYLES